MYLKITISPPAILRRFNQLMPILSEHAARSETGVALESINKGFLMIFQDATLFDELMSSLEAVIITIAENWGNAAFPGPAIGEVEIPIEMPEEGVTFTLDPSGPIEDKAAWCAHMVEIFEPIRDIIQTRLLPRQNRVEFWCPTVESYSLMSHLFTDRHIV
jgi:hypothetical protein